MSEHRGKYAHHSYNGWRVECECGWESKTYLDRADADAALDQHIKKIARWFAGSA